MEIVDLPKTETEEQLNTNQVNDLFNSIVRGKDVVETIKTSKGDFRVKFPRMKDVEAIGRLTAYRLNGISVESFDINTYNLIQQISYLDNVVLSGPAWFENAKKDNVNFGFGNIPLQSFVQEVYAKAYDFRLKVQEMLESDSRETDSRLDSKPDSTTTNEPGLFDGVSSQ